jgi:hypothetical protein
MERRQLATALIASDAAEQRERLLRTHWAVADSRLARDLHAIYQETREGEPPGRAAWLQFIWTATWSAESRC